MRVNIDDRNTSLITYEGQWDDLRGSSRQWEEGVHATGAAGATATFRFRGLQVWVWGTIPAGTDSKSTIDIKVDNEDAVTQVRTSNGSAVYAEVFFQSPLLRETYHTVVITNKISTAAGANEFMLDRFEFETNDQVPLFAPGGTSASTGNPGGSTPTGTAPGGQIASSGGSKTPLGAILGAVVGVLAVIIIILGYILWRRRRSEKPKEAEVLTTDEVASPGTRSRITFNPFSPVRRSSIRASGAADTTSQVVPFSPTPVHESTVDTPASIPSPQRQYQGKAAMMEEARLASRPSIATDISQIQSQRERAGSLGQSSSVAGVARTVSSPGTANELSSLYTSDAQSPLIQHPQPTLPPDTGLIPPPPYDLNPR